MGQIFQTQLLFWPSRAWDKCNFESSFALFKAKCERPSQQESKNANKAFFLTKFKYIKFWHRCK